VLIHTTKTKKTSTYIELGELVEDTFETLVKVLLSELDLAHVKVANTTDSKVRMDDLQGLKAMKRQVVLVIS
jgi:hypothetical protein